MASQNLHLEPAPLERERHKHLRLKPLGDYRYASHLHSSVVAGPEFFSASGDFPVMFVKGAKDKFVALAVLSLKKSGHDLGDDWKGVYVPAYVRRYPFVMDSGSSVLYFDKQCTALQEGEGEPLFEEDGSPSKLLNEILVFNKQVDELYKKTADYLEALVAKDLLEPFNGKIRINNEDVLLNSFFVVNEKKFHETLEGDELADWFKKGWIGWTYAHLNSIHSMTKVAQRLQDTAPAKAS